MNVSVLIPVYNHNISPLVNALYKQLVATNQDFEILLIDDCSTLSSTYINLKTKQLSNVNYTVLTTNIGRSAIRNLLFEKAKFDCCICMDCDMLIAQNTQFIATYLNEFEENKLLVGGHIYQSEKPLDTKKLLHWNYGKEIEAKTAEERKKSGKDVFMSSNFACSKETFKQLKFNESIREYGHEDTLLAYSAKKNNVSIKHIENPLLHNGLDDTEVFLAKQKQAVQNLKSLYKNEQYKAFLQKNSTLIAFATKPLLPFFIKAFKSYFSKNLNSKTPKLNYLQFMKIIWWNKK